MRAGPFELGRFPVGGRKMQRRAIVSGRRRCAGPFSARKATFFRPKRGVLEHLALARRGRITCALRPDAKATAPPAARRRRWSPIFAADLVPAFPWFRRAGAGRPCRSSPAVSSALPSSLTVAASNPSWATTLLVAVVEPVDHAVGQREMRDVAQPGPWASNGCRDRRGAMVGMGASVPRWPATLPPIEVLRQVRQSASRRRKLRFPFHGNLVTFDYRFAVFGRLLGGTQVSRSSSRANGQFWRAISLLNFRNHFWSETTPARPVRRNCIDRLKQERSWRPKR